MEEQIKIAELNPRQVLKLDDSIIVENLNEPGGETERGTIGQIKELVEADLTTKINTAIDNANNATKSANQSAVNANNATTEANQAATKALQDGQTAIANANAAGETAINNANTAGQNAVNIANQAAITANNAATNANSAGQEALSIAEIGATNANNAAEDAKETIERLEELEESLINTAQMMPTSMTLEYPAKLTLGNNTRKITPTLMPGSHNWNVIYQGDNKAVEVAPDGVITTMAPGVSRIYCIPTLNTTLYQAISIEVGAPEMRLTEGASMRLLSNGNIRKY